jgi:hypothetical protein
VRARRCSQGSAPSSLINGGWPRSQMALVPEQISDSAPVKCRSAGSQMPSELVGVARFEPAASSSRTSGAAGRLVVFPAS